MRWCEPLFPIFCKPARALTIYEAVRAFLSGGLLNAFTSLVLSSSETAFVS